MGNGVKEEATPIWRGKTVVVGVTGGIAAYKACELVSRLTKFGAEVHVIMTAAAANFIGVTTLRELSRNPVVVDMFAQPVKWHVQHIALAKAAEIFMIVPATANIIGKLACGIADDMLSTTVLATRAPLLLAPAMNTRMYENPIVQANLHRLKEAGFSVVEPESGWLAEGEEGKGRLASTEEILAAGEALLARRRDFVGKTILVTAGATRERLDPFRFITNASTGKMGYAVAEAALARGAQVVLISGPGELPPPQGARVRKVESALEMYGAVMEEFPEADVVIKAAAVGDYRPAEASPVKIKKDQGELTVTLVKNPDILTALGQRKGRKILVGFAAESNNILEYAREKLRKKNADLIVANDITQEGAGFAGDTNVVHLVAANGEIESLPVMSKREVADRILDRVLALSGGH